MTPFVFPALDPVAFSFGPLAVRWYALAYIAGLLFARWYAMRLAARAPRLLEPRQVDDFLFWAVIGVIVGGRLGHVLFYEPLRFLASPLDILKVWTGGMSFHGGLLGVAAAMVFYARRQRIPLLALADLAAVTAPAGLFLGRVANFINQELWGRVTDVPWAVVFPRAGPEPRHPSQLYEAALEGLLLFALLALLARHDAVRRRPGLLTGLFLCGYALARGVAEIFREPEILAGALPFATTYGQWLSLPMLLAGLWLARQALVRPVQDVRLAGRRGP